MVTKKTIPSSAEGDAKPLTQRQRAERWLAKDEAGATSGTTAHADAYALATAEILRAGNLDRGRPSGPEKLKQRSAENRARMRELAADAYKNPHIRIDGKSIAHDQGARAKWILHIITIEKRLKVNDEPYSLRTVKDAIGGIDP